MTRIIGGHKMSRIAWFGSRYRRRRAPARRHVRPKTTPGHKIPGPHEVPRRHILLRRFAQLKRFVNTITSEVHGQNCVTINPMPLDGMCRSKTILAEKWSRSVQPGLHYRRHLEIFSMWRWNALSDVSTHYSQLIISGTFYLLKRDVVTALLKGSFYLFLYVLSYYA